jgi:S-DNA-T family DNA segregation ATPase FtsK/SpoIIIE
MLISHGSELLRLQCAFVDTPEVEKIVEFIGSQQGYPHAHPLPEPEMDEEDGGNKTFDKKNKDKLFEDCARVVVQTQSGSTSMLQRRFNLGYNRAGRIMDLIEAAVIVGPASGSKPRDVLFRTESELEEFLHNLE